MGKLDGKIGLITGGNSGIGFAAAQRFVADDGFVTEAYFDPRSPEDLLGPVAHSIAALFAGLDRNKIRKCSNCVLHFLDTSKKGTRRWCSMQMCGNRSKVAAYAARHRR